MWVAEFAVSPRKRFGWFTPFCPTFGLGTPAHHVPSKCSIKVSVAACLGGATGVENPTAQTSFGASARTAFNLFVPSPTLGVATLFQFVPSQCIAEVSILSEPLNPTAQASFVASADAPNRNSFFGPAVVAAHAAPFQCSKSGETSPVPRFTRLPIAQTSFAELEVMAKTFAWSFFPNLGTGNKLHLVPFHCSITCPGWAPSVTFPAAQAKVGEIATTPCRKLLLTPLIIGAENAVHVVPSKWIVDCPPAQISLGEDAEAAKSSLLGLSFGVATTSKVEPACVCPCTGKCCNKATLNPKNIIALNVSLTIPP